jgi:hypothetical protein
MVIVAAIGFVGGLVPAWLDDTQEELASKLKTEESARAAVTAELEKAQGEVVLRDQARQECVDEITTRLDP